MGSELSESDQEILEKQRTLHVRSQQGKEFRTPANSNYPELAIWNYVQYVSAYIALAAGIILLVLGQTEFIWLIPVGIAMGVFSHVVYVLLDLRSDIAKLVRK